MRSPRCAVAAAVGLVVLGASACDSGQQNLSQADKDAKVTVCHRLGNDNYRQLEIERSALDAHLGHGDIYPVPDDGCPTDGGGGIGPATTEGGGGIGPATTEAPPHDDRAAHDRGADHDDRAAHDNE